MIRCVCMSFAAIAAILGVPRSPLAQSPTPRARIIFVDDDAPPGGDGKSWKSALCFLQDALALARSEIVSEIRVAQGTYKPDQGVGYIPGDVNAAFELIPGVTLHGGYAGIGTPHPSSCSPTLFASVLSGDLLGNDGPNFTNYGDNTYRVIRATRRGTSTFIAGFTITASQRNVFEPLSGGGLFCAGGDVTVHDCQFERNRAYLGAAFAVESGHLILRRCALINNYSDYSGAGDVRNPGSLEIEDCLFTKNRVVPHNGGALGLPLTGAAVNVVRRCIFEENTTESDGGAIYGGGANALVEDCTFIENHASWMGGAVAEGSGVYRRCRFENNSAFALGGAFASGSPLATTARFIDCDFINNSSAINWAGAVAGGKTFFNCRFAGNHTGGDNDGGAIRTNTAGTLIANCTFSGNNAGGRGGAVYASVATTIINSTFNGNFAGMGGAAVGGSATICNSVFGQHTGGAPLAGVGPVSYSIVPGDSPLPAGVGNIIADPRFVNALGPDGVAGTEDDDLRLRPDSPCIDAGDTTALPADVFDLDNDGDSAEPLPLDLHGNRRALQTPATPDTGVPPDPPLPPAIVDMGAIEYRRPADIAPEIGDGNVDVDDMIAVILGWGPCPPAPIDCRPDIDGDGEVGVSDLIAVILGWG
jgi:predicted outer membrane repeat protein